MMKTKYVAVAIGTLMFLGTALPASASALTSTQISAIISLLQSFGADQATINDVNQALGGSPTPSSSSCVNLTHNLTLGVRGNDVTNLQNYLAGKGYLSAGYTTGYYGYMTVQAVGKLQISLGLLSSSNDPAYGLVGPLTRKAVGCASQSSSNSTFSASPTSGAAPLNVQFTISGRGNYQLDFGDGQTVGPAICMEGSICSPYTLTHTYTSTGTYTANLLQSDPAPACSYATPPCLYMMPVRAPQVMGTVTITVTSGSPVGVPSISGIDAPASLAVGQMGTWIVHATVPNQPGAQLSYSVKWGDEAANPINYTGSAAAIVRTSTTFTHTYSTAGSYQPTFTVTNGSGSVQGSASVVVGQTTNSPTISVSETPSTVAGGSTQRTTGGSVAISWNSQNAPSGSLAQLWLMGSDGKNYGIITTGQSSGSYSWAVPGPHCDAQGNNCMYQVDGCGISFIDPGSYYIVAKLYQPISSVPGQPVIYSTGCYTAPSYLASAQTNTFMIASSATAFSATPTFGTSPLAVSFSFNTAAYSTVSSWSNANIDFGDGSSTSWSSGFQHRADCMGTTAYCNSTPDTFANHTYSAPGTYITNLTAGVCQNSTNPCTEPLLGTATITVR